MLFILSSALVLTLVIVAIARRQQQVCQQAQVLVALADQRALTAEVAISKEKLRTADMEAVFLARLVEHRNDEARWREALLDKEVVQTEHLHSMVAAVQEQQDMLSRIYALMQGDLSRLQVIAKDQNVEFGIWLEERHELLSELDRLRGLLARSSARSAGAPGGGALLRGQPSALQLVR
ncbi:MAG: hypothetical protein H6739_39355 [Alphaproteobacteria bacterium]|nr:hypothetical protein [Alphaproteobacteria bacterium]